MKVIHGVYSLSAVQFMVNSQGRSMTNLIIETFKAIKGEIRDVDRIIYFYK